MAYRQHDGEPYYCRPPFTTSFNDIDLCNSGIISICLMYHRCNYTMDGSISAIFFFFHYSGSPIINKGPSALGEVEFQEDVLQNYDIPCNSLDIVNSLLN